MEKQRDAIAIMTFIAPSRSTWKALFRRRCKLFWIAEAALIRSSCSAGGLQKQSVFAFTERSKGKGWRRGELNPCPRRFRRKHLHAYPMSRF
jgi:hypothetical protein